MVIDVNERCASLGIDYRDYSEAVRLQGRMVYKRLLEGDDSVDSYIDDIKTLPPKPMVALIRYDELYKQYPKVFDFDGPVPGVEAPYPYADRDN